MQIVFELLQAKGLLRGLTCVPSSQRSPGDGAGSPLLPQSLTAAGQATPHMRLRLDPPLG